MPAGSTSTGSPDRRYLRDKLLVPFLGDQYGAVLEVGAAHPQLRRGSGQLRRLGLRHAQAADLPAALRAHPRRRRIRSWSGSAMPFRGLPDMAAAGRPRARSSSRRSWPRSVREQGRCARTRSRPQSGALQRRAGATRELDAARRADPGAVLARRAFPRRRRRHQLPPLLQHQRSRRHAHGAAGGVRPRASPGVPAAAKTACSTDLRIDHVDGLLDPKGY